MMDIKPTKVTSLPVPHSVSVFPADQPVDLLQLIDILWRAKKRILMLVFCFGLVGFAASLLLPQKWTSTAVVTLPETNQLTSLNTVLAATQVLGVESQVNGENIFNLFIKRFNSALLLEQYVESTPELMARFSGTDADLQALHRAIMLMSGKLKATDDASNKKADQTPYSTWTLSFTGPNPQEAQMILKGYISHVADTVVKQTVANLHEAVAMRAQIENQRLELDRVKLENIKETKIKRLSYSLEVAKAAGITRPVYSNGQAIKDDPDFSVTLGTDGISKKLEIEKSIQDVSTLDADILNREYMLRELENMDIKNIQFPVLNYQLSPSMPLKKNGPGHGLIILLAMLFGGLLSCGVVLFQHARETRRPSLSVSETKE